MSGIVHGATLRPVDIGAVSFEADRGVITISENFDAPLSPEMLTAFEA